MRRITTISLLSLCVFATLTAQNEIQALRYSMIQPFGTARYAALGGATGALGGDLSAIQVNPAGLAFYRASELSVSPSFYWVSTSSSYMGTRTGDSRLRFTLGSAGYVISLPDRGISGSLAFGYNTLANYNSRTTIHGINDQSSYLDDFTWHANADPDRLSPFYEQVASDVGLLPYDSVGGYYWNDIENGGYGQEQSRYVERSGHIGEYAFSGAFNFGDIVYLGATFGIHSVRFYEDIYHTESDPQDILLLFDSFRFREFNTTRGWGYTARFGLIVRPLQFLRLGATFQIPTFYYLTEEKYTDANSYWDRSSGFEDGYASSPSGIYDYHLRTPLRTGAHASFILFKMATISVAYDFVDFGTARLDAYDDKFLAENDHIRRDLRATHNLKAGTELRFDMFYFRGGFQYLMSPFTDSRNNAEEYIFSGGFGVRTRHAYFDTSYSRGNRSEVYGLYSPTPNINEVSVNQVNPNNLMFTVGFRF